MNISRGAGQNRRARRIRRTVDSLTWYHTATPTANGRLQSLFLDDDLRIGMAGSPTLINEDPQNYSGAGVFPADTSQEMANAPAM